MLENRHMSCVKDLPVPGFFLCCPYAQISKELFCCLPRSCYLTHCRLLVEFQAAAFAFVAAEIYSGSFVRILLVPMQSWHAGAGTDSRVNTLKTIAITGHCDSFESQCEQQSCNR
jgi:hypothetical protein